MNEDPKKANPVEWGILFAVIGTGITILAVMVSMFLWLRSEANADRREFNAKMDYYVMQLQNESKQFRDESNQFREEMKQFHGKQCSFQTDIENLKREVAKK